MNTERPLPVSASCASAIIEGRKSMARYVTSQPPGECPFGKAGDLLWVAEPWASIDGTLHYKADSPGLATEWGTPRSQPRDSARALVRLVSARLERLQEITAHDVVLEGSLVVENSPSAGTAVEAFAQWWDSVHPKPGTQWIDNPVVWVLTFEKTPA